MIKNVKNQLKTVADKLRKAAVPESLEEPKTSNNRIIAMALAQVFKENFKSSSEMVLATSLVKAMKLAGFSENSIKAKAISELTTALKKVVELM